MNKSFLLFSVLSACIVPNFCAVCEYQFRKICYELSRDEISIGDAYNACEHIGGRVAVAGSRRIAGYLSTMMIEKNLENTWVHFGLYEYQVGERLCPNTLNRTGGLRENENDMGQCVASQTLFAICEFDIDRAPLKKCKADDSIIKDGFLMPCTKEKGVELGTKLRVECWAGFSLNGPAEITCEDNGTWSKLPKCEPLCDASIFQRNGVTIYPLTTGDADGQKKYYKVNEAALIICEKGIIGNNIFPVTHKIVRCVDSNKWSDEVPYCLPYDKISYSHSMKAQNILRVSSHSLLSIDCPSENGDDILKVWTKDQKQVAPNERYVINKNGTLTIKDFGLEDVGHYVCTTQITTSSFEFVSYELLEKKELSFYAESIRLIRIKEEESSILLCKDSNHLSKHKWYKNGIPYIGTEFGSSIRSDGALYLNNVTQLDDGFYLCVVESFLADTALIVTPYQIKVTPKSKGVCGQIYNWTTVNSADMQIEEFEDYDTRAAMFQHIPWFVPFFSVEDRYPFCYGSLIDVQWVLTSAKCFANKKEFSNLVARIGISEDDRSKSVFSNAKIWGNEDIEIHFVRPENFTVPVQSIDNKRHFYIPSELIKEDMSITSVLEADSDEQQDFPIEEVIIHPDFSGGIDNDLALIRLKKDIIVTDNVRPICLPDSLSFTDDPNCIEVRIRIGRVNTQGIIEKRRFLNTVGKLVTIHGPEKCEKILDTQLGTNLICTADLFDLDEGMTKFKGDLGAPLEVSLLNRYVLWGVHTKAVRRYFEYYTVVLPYLNWIIDTITTK